MRIPLLLACLVIANDARADTCLRITGIKGQSAYAIDSASAAESAFRDDGFSDPAIREFCYNGDTGEFQNVDGYDGEVFSRIGESTWIYFNSFGGTELTEVWTFDLNRMRVMLARVRTPGMLPATAGAYVGTIVSIRSD